MGQEILINVTPQETRVAVLEHGVAQELHIERSSSLGIVSNVYRGKVCRVLPGMQSAFVEIGLQRAAFLHAADVMECHIDGEPQIERPIQEVLREGEPGGDRSLAAAGFAQAGLELFDIDLIGPQRIV